jgi:formylglycine-generating enzyme required for sulfatase activity
MKLFYTRVSLTAMLIYVLSACTLGSGGPVGEATQPPATEIPGAVIMPSEVPTTLVEVPIDLAGPPMEVGSQYLYVDGSIIVAVPGGEFIMGNNNIAETPERKVSIGDFWIYNSEVTNSQYARCVEAGECSSPNLEKNPQYQDYRSASLPVVGVNYQQSVDYCSFVHGRLPTEAEWEKSARGPQGNLFPWGDNAPSCDLLNYNFCKGKALDIQSYVDGVSFYGLFDMSGNVREWVADWYDINYYKNGPLQDPLGPELGDKRSVRSSSFADSGDAVLPANRFSLKPTESLEDLGFRCVVEDPTFFAPFCEQLAFIGSGPNGAESDCVPEVYCNDVGIGISEIECHVGDVDAVTIVNFSVDPAPYDTIITEAAGCSAGPGALQYTCLQSSGASSAKATGACYDGAQCDPSCGPHYTLSGDTCVWDGTGTLGTQCLPGTTYDPVNQCCSAIDGSGVDYTVCPDGSSSIGGLCVADPSKVVDTELKPITFDSCAPPPDGECDPLTDPACQPACDPLTDPACQPTCNPRTDPDCQPPPNGCQNPPVCQSYEKFCSSSCSCVYNTLPCP